MTTSYGAGTYGTGTDPAPLEGVEATVWPPVIPPNTRTNATAQLNVHPADHNQLADAVTSIVANVTRRLGSATSSAATTGIGTTDTDVVPVTVTVAAGHRLRISGVVNVQGGAAGQVVYALITDAANTVIGTGFQTPGTGFASVAVVCEVPAGSAGSRTYKLRTAANAGTFQLNPLRGAVHSILVDDAGP